MAAKSNRKQATGELHSAILNNKAGKIVSVGLKLGLPPLMTLKFFHEYRQMISHPEGRDGTPLLAAIIIGLADVCKCLIAEGADVNAGLFGGLRPLTVALDRQNYKLAMLLIRSGAHVNIFNASNLTPMYYAIREESPVYIIQELLEAGFPKDGTIAVLSSPVTGKQLNSRSIVHAIMMGNIPIVKFLLGKSVDINVVGFETMSLLSLAVSKECLEIVEELVKHGAQVEGQGQNDPPPLLVAAEVGKADIINALLHAGACVNRIFNPREYVHINGNPFFTTALHTAVSHNNFQAVKMLIEGGADINLSLPFLNATPLHYNSSVIKRDLKKERKKDYISILQLLLERGASTDAKDLNGLTPLEGAVESGNWDSEEMEVWIRHGTDVNKPICRKYDTSILCLAIRKNRKDLIDLCLSFGGDVFSSVGDESVYRLVLTFCDIFILKRFWRHGYPYNDFPLTIRTDLPKNPNCQRILVLMGYQRELMNGIKSNNPQAVEDALRKGAEANSCSMDVKYPLHLASLEGFSEIVKILLREGVPPSTLDSEGMTPLHLAAQAGHVHVCEALLQQGACYNYCGPGRKTPLLLASESGFCEVTELLRSVEKMFQMVKTAKHDIPKLLEKIYNSEEKSKFMNCIDRQGRTMIEKALYYGNEETLEGILSWRFKTMT